MLRIPLPIMVSLPWSGVYTVMKRSDSPKSRVLSTMPVVVKERFLEDFILFRVVMFEVVVRGEPTASHP